MTNTADNEPIRKVTEVTDFQFVFGGRILGYDSKSISKKDSTRVPADG